jgi:Rab-like protein 2
MCCPRQAAPKDDFYQEVLDLLGEISMDTRKQLEDAVKALEQEGEGEEGK